LHLQDEYEYLNVKGLKEYIISAILPFYTPPGKKLDKILTFEYSFTLKKRFAGEF
jgi:hypothetical protein